MRIRSPLLCAMLAGLPVALLPMSSQATTVTSAFNVTLTLANACTFGAASR